VVNELLFRKLTDEFVEADQLWATLSVLFVFCYMVYHLDSKFLALISISIILLSFPLTIIICKGVFRISYFGLLNGIAIFIVLGIAADNVFVFYDAWR